MNILFLLEAIAGMYGDRAAVSAGDLRITYEALLTRAQRLAGPLGAHAAGRPVLYVGANSAAFVELLFGSAAAGVPLIPVNFRATRAEFAHILRVCGCAMAIAEPRYGEALRAAARGAGSELRVVDVDALDGLRAAEVPLPSETSDMAVGLFTSGTTGPAKLVRLTHENLSSYVLGTVIAGSADDDEAALLSAPVYHVAAIANMLSTVFRGRRLVLLPQFDAEQWVRVAATERVTHAMVVPTMLAGILDVVEREHIRLDALRSLSYGGSKASEQLVVRALRVLPHVDFVNAFGLTETSSTVAMLDPEDHRAALASDDPAVRRRLRAVGRPVPGIELQIRDGKCVLAAGEVGRICLRGDQIASTYADGKSILDRDGWLVTGDNGYLDQGGYLFVVDRSDDVIIRGGENISPDEIEEVLRGHPLVEDAAVVGVPDPHWGQIVVAAYEGSAAAELDLQAWVRADLAGYKVPVRIRHLETLPRNPLGKILRREVQMVMAQWLS